MVRPSIQPSSRNRSTKAAVHALQIEASAPRNPTVGSLPACCARAASGHVAAPPPTSVMNSRRLIGCAPLIVSDTLARRWALHGERDDVRFGSKAEVKAPNIDVRFTPE